MKTKRVGKKCNVDRETSAAGILADSSSGASLFSNPKTLARIREILLEEGRSMSLEQLRHENVELTLKLAKISANEALREELNSKLKVDRYRAAALIGHKKNRERADEIRRAYLQGSYSSKAAAAVKLAPKFGVSHRTVEKYLSKVGPTRR